jgi:hypothetical protein
MTVPKPTPRVRSAAEKARTRTFALTLVGIFGVLVALNLIITGLGDPPSIVPPVTLAENTGVPPVPTNADFPYDRTHTLWAIVLLGAVGAIGFAWALSEVIRKRDWMPLCLSLGGVAIVIPEVFVDIVGMVYYPTSDSDHAFDLFGRQMGWFILAGWFGAGAFGALMLKQLLTRPSAKQVWILLGVTAVSYTIFEELLVGAGGIYHYYGNQPMWWHNLPLWWTPCNTLGAALLPALFAYRYQAILKGWHAVLMILVVPTCVSAGYALIAMPGWIVVNGDYAWLPTELAGLAVWALGIAVAAMAMNLLLGYQPFDPESRPWDLSEDAQEPTQLNGTAVQDPAHAVTV